MVIRNNLLTMLQRPQSLPYLHSMFLQRPNIPAPLLMQTDLLRLAQQSMPFHPVVDPANQPPLSDQIRL